MRRTKDERRIVCVGGGTGLSTLLRGLKLYAADITAIVTVADNGGSSGQLRREMGILPPGDIRNCVLALAEIEPLMEKVYQYRFSEGSLKGQNLGNLIIAALTDISGGSFEKAVEQWSDILAVDGYLLGWYAHFRGRGNCLSKQGFPQKDSDYRNAAQAAAGQP